MKRTNRILLYHSLEALKDHLSALAGLPGTSIYLPVSQDDMLRILRSEDVTLAIVNPTQLDEGAQAAMQTISTTKVLWISDSPSKTTFHTSTKSNTLLTKQEILNAIQEHIQGAHHA